MNIPALRKETSGTNHVIHFNNAGSSLTTDLVRDTVKNYIDEEAKLGGYETADKNRKGLEGFYDAAASLINGEKDEIAYTESATVAWDRAFYSIPFDHGDNIITVMADYASNYIAYLQLQKRVGIEIRVAPDNQYGETDVKALENLIDQNTRLIAVTHIPTNGGLVNPAEKIGEVAKKHNILYLLDACQSIGQYPIDVKQIGCDFLSATGRKYLRAPRGTGFLYASKNALEQLEPASLDLHSADWVEPDSYVVRHDARKFETWEANLAAKMGMKAAIDYLLGIGIDQVWERVVYLSTYLRNKLIDLDGIVVTDQGQIKSGIVTFDIASIDHESLKLKLRAQGINVSVVYANSSLLDMQSRNFASLIRASVHYYNTEEEIDQFCNQLTPYL